jgi:hypothetical protein
VATSSEAEQRSLVSRSIAYHRRLGRTVVTPKQLGSKEATDDLLFKAKDLEDAIEAVGVTHAEATFIVLCPETNRPVQQGGVEFHCKRPSEIPDTLRCENVPASPHLVPTAGNIRLQIHRGRPGSHVVLIVHGIRTQAEWLERATATLQTEQTIRVVPAGYGYFDLFRFLLPIAAVRQRPIDRIEAKLRDVLQQHPEHLSIVAHSFGTFIVSKIIEQNADIDLYRLILCGSIIPTDFPWERYRHRLAPGEPVAWQAVNDCGMLDPWPVFAQTITWGYGSSGRFGFRHGRVKDRFHKFRHGDFFRKEFVRKSWLPYLADGRIVEGEIERPTTSWLLSILTVVKVPHVIAGVAIAAIIVWWLLRVALV